MKWLVPVYLALCLAAAGCKSDDGIARLRTDGQVIEAVLPRYGLNLGGSSSWGAEQLRANVLINPGFEAVLDRSIVIVKQAAGNRVVDDTDWLARADGFWSGGHYSVRSGLLAGSGGRILDSRKRASDGLAEFWLDPAPHGLRTGDVLSVTRERDVQPAPQWWRGKGRVLNVNDTRPGSLGRQSVRLAALPGQPAELLHYLDNISLRAGKLLPLTGPWRLSFWARSASRNSQLHVHLDRAGTPAFLDTDITPGPEWRLYEFTLDADDAGPPGALTLGLRADSGEVLIDDAYLGETTPAAGGFRHAVVDTLKSLRPGYLRDWQGQLGDTLDNRLAPAHGHQPVRYRPGDNELQFHYSLPDFLALCAAVGAQPWVVAPTTLDDEEWRRLGRYLREAADRHGFSEVMLEFGNENWNLIFRPGGIPVTAAHAAVADRAFALLRQGSRHDARLQTIVNAQFVNPDSPRQTGAASRHATRVAVAPYFLYQLDDGTPLADAVQAAFAETDELIRRQAAVALQQGKRLAIYEENFHTTLGNARPELRDTVVTSAAAGPALARRLLQGTLAGVREQAVYSFAGFDSYLQEGKGLVRLWGVTRDLSYANRLRPTGLALELLNRVAGGTVRTAPCEGQACTQLTTVAFDDGRSLAVVSASAHPALLQVTMPCPQGVLWVETLDGSAPQKNNEQDIQVHLQSKRLQCRDQRVELALPPHSLTVLRP